MIIDRLAPRTRPRGTPLMHQTWGGLLFMHWPLPEQLLRPLVPDRLQIDSWEGTAWVGITPFELWGTRPALLPAVPVISASYELNVRTYVHLDGVPGVWFFSLDASNPLMVAAARLTYHLPYFRARMSRTEAYGIVEYTSARTHPGAPPAEFRAAWAVGEPRGSAEPETLDFFLVERYSLYASRGPRLYRARIAHAPWPLRGAELASFSSTMLESHGLPSTSDAPLLHQQAEPLEVAIWPLRMV